ncbi:FtsX-like permease family protein (plasmid) [Lactococcus garvieae]|uniref:ABC transporter permease n=1 Tax=Lactococcus garvieae TaxID=1363 RepID=UPI0030CA7868
MPIFYRTLHYLIFHKVKTILLVVVITLLSFLVLLSMTMGTTLKYLSDTMNTDNGIAVSLRASSKARKDMSQLMKSLSSDKGLNEEKISDLENLPYLEKIVKESSTQATSKGIKPVPFSGENAAQIPDEIKNRKEFDIQGSTDGLKWNKSFEEGIAEITEGKPIKKEGEIAISKAFAKLNKLKVGDTLTLKSATQGEPQLGDGASNSEAKKVNEVKATVSGIWDYSQKATENDMASLSDRTVFSDISTVQALEEGNDMFSRNRFILKNADSLNAFKKDYFKITGEDPEMKEMSVENETYKNVIAPLKTMQNVVLVLKNIMIVIAIVFIVIIWTLSIKERNQEIAVLYSLGEKKRNIVVQFIEEAGIVTAIGFFISLPILLFSANPIMMALGQEAVTSENKELSGMGVQMASEKRFDTSVFQVQYDWLQIMLVFIVLITVIILINAFIVSSVLKKPVRDIFYQ